MNNQLLGIITITFCLIGYFYSWKYQAKNNYTIAVLLLCLCGLLLRTYASLDLFLHEWDERFHALVAKNLVRHPLVPTLYDNPVLPYDFKNWYSNHIWLHKQPLPLWIMSAFIWAFGTNEIAVRLPSIILTTIGIYLTFYIGSNLFNKKTGFIAAFLFSINGLIIELASGRVATDHIDVFFLFFVELAVFFIIVFIQNNRTIYNILAGASIGAAILSKWLPALIVIPIWLLLVIDSKRFKPKSIFIQFSILLFFCILIAAPWQIYIFSTFPMEANWELKYNINHFSKVIESHEGSFYYFINKIRVNYGELIYLPVLWFFWKAFTNPDRLKRLSISIWFLIPFIFFSFAKTKMQGYILFTSPALFIMTSDFWVMLSNYKKEHTYKWLFDLTLVLLIALPLRYTIERVKPFVRSERNPQWVNDLKKFNDKKIVKGILFNYNRPIEAMFYTDLIAYSGIPDSTKIINLIHDGYTVIFNKYDQIPNNLVSIEGVKFENLKTSD